MREATLSAHLDYPGNDLSISNRFALSSRLDSLYVLQSDGIRGFYSLYDSQNRRNLNYLGVAQYSPSDNFQLRVQETHQRRTTGFSANKVRDNADYSNQALLALDLNPWPAFKWQNTIRHGYDIKDFVYSEKPAASAPPCIGNTAPVIPSPLEPPSTFNAPSILTIPTAGITTFAISD